MIVHREGRLVDVPLHLADAADAATQEEIAAFIGPIEQQGYSGDYSGSNIHPVGYQWRENPNDRTFEAYVIGEEPFATGLPRYEMARSACCDHYARNGRAA